MANREQLEELANTIKESIDSSIKSAFQSVVIPADADTLVQDISQSFETKNMSSLATAIEKTNTLIEKVGFNLEKFNKGINDTFEKYLAQKTGAEKQVEVMKERNIIGQTELIENEIRATTVSNKELTIRKEIIQREEEQLRLKEEEFNPQELALLQEDADYNEGREFLQKEKKSIQKTEQQNNAELGDVIGSNRTAGGFHRIPEFLQGPVSTFTEALMTPVNMIKEIIGTFKDFGKAIKQTAQFIVGNFLEGLKKVRKGFRRLRRRMRRMFSPIGRFISSIGKGAAKMALFGGLFAAGGAVVKGIGRAIKPIAIALGGLTILWKLFTKDFDRKVIKFLFGEKGLRDLDANQIAVKTLTGHKTEEDLKRDAQKEKDEIVKAKQFSLDYQAREKKRPMGARKLYEMTLVAPLVETLKWIDIIESKIQLILNKKRLERLEGKKDDTAKLETIKKQSQAKGAGVMDDFTKPIIQNNIYTSADQTGVNIKNQVDNQYNLTPGVNNQAMGSSTAGTDLTGH